LFWFLGKTPSLTPLPPFVWLVAKAINEFVDRLSGVADWKKLQPMAFVVILPTDLSIDSYFDSQ